MSQYYATVNQRAPGAEYDRELIWVTVLLLAFGLVMVYSASIAIAEASRSTGNNAAHYLMRHAFFVLVSLVGAGLAFQVPLRIWQQAAPFLFVAGLVLLVLVLVPGIGREVNGSRRWLSLYVVNLQPSELMKVCVLLYGADYTVRKAALMHSLARGFLPMLGVMLLTGALLLLEPDFGAFAVITVIAMGILFLGGMNWRLFAGLIVMLVIGFLLLIWTSPYRMQRVIGFMDPWADPYGKGYQLSHALIAFGRGEWFGVGLGASVEKLFYLPEAHTDFLLAVIAHIAVCVDRLAGVCHWPARGRPRAAVRGAGGAGHRFVDRRAGDHQHGRQHGCAADQGADTAAAVVRRQRDIRHLLHARRAAARRLGKQTARAGVHRMTARELMAKAAAMRSDLIGRSRNASLLRGSAA
jgi:cell division protein FtsW